ncbi:hypothetical protein TPHA_0H00730 [Tetrapisispora phaffii CBS 4417]|uniref:Probable electron transfer flavoprotein subunit alpha n=1 Tax=Tetrapisispora phaffii (strain ATCC 24235 / CBS 4417 / NBRC 1672 / NRRL Y-8282 / UCD 70-5) TaxID=1071381 RepID=G8BWX9_TETPH|nr:hypothetical protein TPHA_0H00730 [Tetrapisispora phaffii CBS 4417]CCE64283.1 hypothetical protein TPHA_0H00730 [Tetrapisispora phaffii CBS 4417]
MFRFTNKHNILKKNFQTFLKVHKSTFAFIETSNDGKLLPQSLSTLSAAQQLNKPIVALILGKNSSKIAESLIKDYKIQQLNEIIYSQDEIFDSKLPEIFTPNLIKILDENNGDNFSNFIISSSNFGKNILPRISSIFNYQPINDVIEIDASDKNIFKRPIFAGNLIETIDSSKQAKKFISIRSSAFPNTLDVTENADSSNSNTEIKELEEIINPENLTITWEGNKIVESKRPDLNGAKIVVAGGRALKDKETFDKLLDPLADKLNAAIGGTRAAVDNNLLDNSLQIGQTGKIVAPDLYVAVGISGAIQHIAGMKNSKKIVAINNDPDAPIFKVADYYIVGDLNAVVPELTEKLP